MKLVITVILEYIGMFFCFYAYLHLTDKYRAYKAAHKAKVPYLHMYGQTYPHDDVFIVGNREGLEQLHKRIEEALKGKKNKKLKELSVTDGEQFECFIICEEEIKEKNILRPYADKTFSGNDSKAIHPYTLAYGNLMDLIVEKTKVK